MDVATDSAPAGAGVCGVQAMAYVRMAYVVQKCLVRTQQCRGRLLIVSRDSTRKVRQHARASSRISRPLLDLSARLTHIADHTSHPYVWTNMPLSLLYTE